MTEATALCIYGGYIDIRLTEWQDRKPGDIQTLGLDVDENNLQKAECVAPGDCSLADVCLRKIRVCPSRLSGLGKNVVYELAFKSPTHVHRESIGEIDDWS